MEGAVTELIVALDVDSLQKEEELLKRLKGTVTRFKVGLQLFTAHGKRAVDLVHRYGGKVFLDLKLYDIPQTVALAVAEAQRLGVDSLSLHLLGGSDMLKAACAVSPRPKLWGVTVLTSLSPEDLKLLHARAALKSVVKNLAHLGWVSGVDATICSPREVAFLRKQFPHLDLRFVTPGIRPAGSEVNDQKRVMTPAEAAELGIDFVVVGRPITHAPDPLRAAQNLLTEMRS